MFKACTSGLLLFFSLTSAVNAGVFAGGQIDSESRNNWYAGVQSEGDWHLMAVTGRNSHEIDGAFYRENYMAAAVGHRWYGEWVANVLLGMENSRLFKDGKTPPAKSYTGVYSQLVLLRFHSKGYLETMASYGVDSEHLWARVRPKFFAPGEILIGPEVFIERLAGSETNGGGVVLEKNLFPYIGSLQLGMKQQNGENRTYLGLEIHRSF